MLVKAEPDSNPDPSRSFSDSASSAKTSLWNQNVSELMEQIASTKPAPGGGSAAVMVACMGTALLRKAAAVSLRKEDSKGDRTQQLEAMLEKLNRWEQILAGAADEDADAFDSCIRALRLPHSTAAEERLREKAVEEAMVRATSVPIAAVAAIRDVVFLALHALPLIHDVILSDAITGLRLLNVGAVCLLGAAESNLSRLVKSPLHAGLSEQMRELGRTTAELEPDLKNRLGSRIRAHS
jgi:formiminotetrahydrofolate cyclodeaminase